MLIAEDGADIEELTPKVLCSAVRNETRQPVSISPKNGAMSVSIARIDKRKLYKRKLSFLSPRLDDRSR